MSAVAPMLETRQLSLAVPGRSLLQALDWRVRSGEFWCVLGRNGAGKSTLLHAIAGLSSQAQGIQGGILLDGIPLAALSPMQMARRRGLLLQQQIDAFSMPVIDAVMAGGFVRGGGAADDVASRKAALQALARVGLAPLAQSDLLGLSGGERQRAGLATLLVQSPRLYLLDEPTSHQDIAAQLDVMALLRALADDGNAVVASCHDINLVSRFATHVLLLGERPGQTWQGPLVETLRVDVLEHVFGCRFLTTATDSGSLFISLPR